MIPVSRTMPHSSRRCLRSCRIRRRESDHRLVQPRAFARRAPGRLHEFLGREQEVARLAPRGNDVDVSSMRAGGSNRVPQIVLDVAASHSELTGKGRYGARLVGQEVHELASARHRAIMSGEPRATPAATSLGPRVLRSLRGRCRGFGLCPRHSVGDSGDPPGQRAKNLRSVAQPRRTLRLRRRLSLACRSGSLACLLGRRRLGFRSRCRLPGRRRAARPSLSRGHLGGAGLSRSRTRRSFRLHSPCLSVIQSEPRTGCASPESVS